MAPALGLHQLPPVVSAGWVPTLLSRVHLWWEPAPTAELALMALAQGPRQLPLAPFVAWEPTPLFQGLHCHQPVPLVVQARTQPPQVQPWQLRVSTARLALMALALVTPRLPPALSVALAPSPLLLGLLQLAPVATVGLAPMEQALAPPPLPLAPCVAWAPTQPSLGLWPLAIAPTAGLVPMAQALGLHLLPPVPSVGWAPTLLSQVHL